MAPPLRTSVLAERRIDHVAAPRATEPLHVQDNVILLRNPLATHARQVPSVPTESYGDDLFGIDVAPRPAGGAAPSASVTPPAARGFVEADEPVQSDPHLGRRQLRLGVIVGLIIAAGIVALAILFRPDPVAAGPSTAAPDTPTIASDRRAA